MVRKIARCNPSARARRLDTVQVAVNSLLQKLRHSSTASASKTASPLSHAQCSCCGEGATLLSAHRCSVLHDGFLYLCDSCKSA